MLSQESKNIISSASGVSGNSSRKVEKEILEKTKQRVSYVTVHRERHRQELKPFHVIAKPLKTSTHIEDRKWLANLVANRTEEDFMHMVPSDEFYIYVIKNQTIKMIGFELKMLKISVPMKDIVKWFRMQDASEFFLCLLQRNFFGF